MSPQLLIQIVETFACLAYVCTAMVFIWQGEVIQRYLQKKTNFYQYDEDIQELPSIMMWLDPMLLDTNVIKLERDFNISFGASGVAEETNLSLGINHIRDSSFIVKLEQTNNGINSNAFKLTPLNFSMPLSSHSLVLTYHFGDFIQNQSSADDHNVLSGAAIILATENNSVQISPDLPKDGEITLVKSALGMASYVFTKPQKHIFLQGQGGCRNQPFNEIIMEKLAVEINNKCP